MSLNAGKILGINISLDSKETILEEIKKYLFQTTNDKRQTTKKITKPFVIVTPNPEQVVLAKQNIQFKNILNQADVAIPDGIGISLAAKFLKSQIPNPNDQRTLKRIAGVEFMEELVAMAAKQGVRIGLIGGKAGLADKALECLQKNYHGLEGWALSAPEFRLDKFGELVQLDVFDQYILTVLKQIHETGVQVVFVGLGAPKQEYIIEELRTKNSELRTPLILMSVGGSLDIIAGKIQRAPLLVRSIGFEWTWRLLKEPWRWRRQLALLTFVGLVIKEKLASQGSPPAGGLRS